MTELHDLIVGAAIRRLRRGRHMTQSQLCIRIGVDQSFITRIESGVPPRTKILRELAAAFDFHPSYFLALIESAEQRADEIGTDVDGVGLRGLAEYVVAEVFR